MCTKTIDLINPAMGEVDNPDTILKIKAILALFIQTMDVSKRRGTRDSSPQLTSLACTDLELLC